MQNGGMIATETETLGNGGNIEIDSVYTSLIDNALLTTASTGEGNAGDIVLTASDELYLRHSTIRTASLYSDGGSIKINSDVMVDLWHSEITASVGGGPETTGGNINIDPIYVILFDSRIIANAFEGAGGNILIVTDNLVMDPDSLISASSQFGIDGTVNIQATTKPYSSGTIPISKEFQKAVKLLREPCMARMSAGRQGSLIVNDREALPLAPGGMLPSPTIIN
jgi:hypothetical protein